MADDYVPQNYQDELDTDPDMTDPVMEENEDLAGELDMPPEELGERLDDLDPDGTNEDATATVEDLDENQDDDTVY